MRAASANSKGRKRWASDTWLCSIEKTRVRGPADGERAGSRHKAWDSGTGACWGGDRGVLEASLGSGPPPPLHPPAEGAGPTAGEIRPASLTYPQPRGWVRVAQQNKATHVISGVPREVTGLPPARSPSRSPAYTQLPTNILVACTSQPGVSKPLRKLNVKESQTKKRKAGPHRRGHSVSRRKLTSPPRGQVTWHLWKTLLYKQKGL